MEPRMSPIANVVPRARALRWRRAASRTDLKAQLHGLDPLANEMVATHLRAIARTAFLALFTFPQLRHHAEILQRRRVLLRVGARGDVAQQPAHDLAAASLRKGIGESNHIGPGDCADFLA